MNSSSTFRHPPIMPLLSLKKTSTFLTSSFYQTFNVIIFLQYNTFFITNVCSYNCTYIYYLLNIIYWSSYWTYSGLLLSLSCKSPLQFIIFSLQHFILKSQYNCHFILHETIVHYFIHSFVETQINSIYQKVKKPTLCLRASTIRYRPPLVPSS